VGVFESEGDPGDRIVASLDELVRGRRAAPPSSVPTVVLTAMKGRPEQYRQPVLDREERLVASMPQARHEFVWDAGHYIHIDQPNRVIDAVRGVLLQIG
jgi:pimeloyl-ACP methyl ester carboxylesterase